MTKNTLKISRLKEGGLLNTHPDRVQVPWFQEGTFFDPNDMAQVKYEMLRQVQVDGIPKAMAASQFGFSRPTFYQAEASFACRGLTGFVPQKRGPQKPHKLNEKIMNFIDTYQQKQPKCGARQLADLIQKEFCIRVHPRSIERAVARKKKR